MTAASLRRHGETGSSPLADSPGLRVLTFSTIYPNAELPNFGIFVENRLRHLVAGGAVEAQVVAPVPWFPSVAPCFRRYAAWARVPRSEHRHGITILHPRYPVIPKLGMNVAPLLLYAAMCPILAKLIASGRDFDLIDAHYFYPDGVAAAMLGRTFGKPFVITARGSDINFLPRYRIPRAFIRWAAGRAAGLIAVSNGLRDAMCRLGMDPARIEVLRNGVDLDMFKPCDRGEVRRELGIEGPVAISVGNLIPLKGHDLVIRAVAALPGVMLLIVGDGPVRADLESLAERLGVANRVRILGRVEHHRLASLYSAADVLVLASSHEGWANVLLEAMACGTPVVASNVSGTPEIVTAPEAGRILPERSPEAIAASLRELLDHPPRREATRRHAEGYSWEATSQGQIRVFRSVLLRHTKPSSS